MHSLPPQTLQGGGIPQAVLALPPTRMSLQSNQRVSAFEVYRKPNTPRNSQSPKPLATSNVPAAASQYQPPPPIPPPFGTTGAAAFAILPNSDLYEKRVNAISDTLGHVSFKQENNNMTDVLRHLREQNNLLLRLCNDLSDELLTVQTRKEEMRLQLEASSLVGNDMVVLPSVALTTATSNSGLGQAGSVVRTGSSISAPVTANVTGGSGSSGVHSNV